jgi:pyruvate formate lyase activating enzyme
VLDYESLPDYPLDEILGYVRHRRGWIDGITVTGGEPTFRNNLADALAVFKSSGLAVKLDTNGSRPDVLEKLIQARLVDAISMDVKAPLTPEEYSRVAGVRVDLRQVKRSIEILKRSDLEVTFRTTVIPGLVQEPQLAAIRKALGDVTRYIVQQFRNTETLDPEFSDLKEFGLERFEEMRSRFEVPFLTPAADRLTCAG